VCSCSTNSTCLRAHRLPVCFGATEKKFKRTEKPVAVALKLKEDSPCKFLLRPWGSSKETDDVADDDFAEEDFD